jgi:hypothetical protein
MKPLALQRDALEQDFAWTPSSSEREPADFCSRDGATALKEKIEAYWAARGQNVMIALHNVGFHPAIRAARYDVRSDMVNGMPRAKRDGRAAAQQVAFVEDIDLADEDIAVE